MNKKDYIIKNNKYDLIPIILKNLSEEHFVSVVADIDFIWDIAEMLYNEYRFTFEFVDINRTEYDKEYILTIGENLTMSIERAYLYSSDKYLGCDGLAFISEDVNSRYISDCKNNKFIDDFRPVIFGYDNDDFNIDSSNEDTNEEESDDKYIKICIKDLVDNFDEFLHIYFNEIF